MDSFKPISSKENSLIKCVSALVSSSKSRRENGMFVLEGLRLCMDALENGIRFDRLIITETAAKKYGESIEKFKENAAEGYIIPDSLFKKISDTETPQGICAVCKTVLKDKNQISPNGRYLGLENIADPSNLGAAARTAEALGADGIILSMGGCDPYSPKVLRASMGTVLRLPLFIIEDFAAFLKETKLKSFACVVDKDAKHINEVEFENGSVVIIGNEANGITEETKEIANNLVTIPMKGRAESLNAAAAAAIAVWEMVK